MRKGFRMCVPPRLPGKSHGKTWKISVLFGSIEKKKEKERGVESGNVKTCRRAALYRWSMQRESPFDKSNLFRFELSVTEGEGWRMSEDAARKSSPSCAPVNLVWSASDSRCDYSRFPINFRRNYDTKNHRAENDRRRVHYYYHRFFYARDAARCTILHHYARKSLCVKISVLTNLCSGKCFFRCGITRGISPRINAIDVSL